MAAEQASDDRGFAARAECCGLAGAGHVLDDFGTLDQQVVQGVVDSIEFGSERRQATGAPAILRSGRFLAQSAVAMVETGLDIILAVWGARVSGGARLSGCASVCKPIPYLGKSSPEDRTTYCCLAC